MRLNKAKTEELAKLISDYRALAGQLSNTVFNVMQKPQLMDERAKESNPFNDEYGSDYYPELGDADEIP